VSSELRVRIEMLTVWHVGTGEGLPGVSDAALNREAGQPVIPATALKGLARDRAAVVAAATGVDLLDTVFGSAPRPGAGPTAGRWAFGTARVDTTTPVGTRVSRHNRIDPETGRVDDDLFFDAEVAAPWVLHATVAPVDGTVADPRERAFVAACLAAIDRVGARRTRGWGACRVRIVDRDGVDVTADTVGTLWSAS